jgi:LysM repeat protein
MCLSLAKGVAMLGASARKIGTGGLCALTLVVCLAGAPRGLCAQTLGTASPSAAAPPEPSAAAADAPRVHVVSPGENLWRVAFQYGVALDDLARANGIEDPTRIEAGRRLVIPRNGARAVRGAAQRADALLARAETALAGAQFERAQQLALAARGELEHEGEPNQCARLEVIDATIEVAYGRDAAAVESFERALVADPDLALDPHSTTPRLLAALEIARSRRAADAASLPAVSAPTP